MYPPADTWKCLHCTSSNPSSAVEKCKSCEAPRGEDGATPPAVPAPTVAPPAEARSALPAPSFSFGVPSAAAVPPAAGTVGEAVGPLTAAAPAVAPSAEAAAAAAPPPPAPTVSFGVYDDSNVSI
jgi:hypothetical protein